MFLAPMRPTVRISCFIMIKLATKRPPYMMPGILRCFQAQSEYVIELVIEHERGLVLRDFLRVSSNIRAECVTTLRSKI